ncbi:MAG: hypothetical protein IJ526_07315 [Lachnospiraceae bacterium]|nr:hypothetical protein [Lachnospiraceae bacterium]
MSAIVSWEYYSSLHNMVSEDEFEKAEVLAETEVRSVIGPIHWAEITDESFGYDALKDCICNVIDTMTNSSRRGLGKGVKSATNDGYTEEYVITSENELKSSLKKSIREALSGTGLVRAY